MNQQRLRWRHIFLNTHSTWLHGDERGFRSRKHRIHSSGDYNNPPPSHEHAPLHRYMSTVSAEPTVLKSGVFRAIGIAILDNLQKQGFQVLIIEVTPTHVHFLVELPDDVGRIKEVVGWRKRFATRAARTISLELKDIEIWAEGETCRAVDSDAHLIAARDYIFTQQGPDAWTWTPENGPAW